MEFGIKVNPAYLDDRDDVLCRRLEFAHVDVEVVQLVLLCLLHHQAAPLADGMDAPQVGCWVQVGIWRRRHGGFGYWMGRWAVVARPDGRHRQSRRRTRRSGTAIREHRLLAVLLEGVVDVVDVVDVVVACCPALLAPEEAHGEKNKK